MVVVACNVLIPEKIIFRDKGSNWVKNSQNGSFSQETKCSDKVWFKEFDRK